MSRSYRRPYAAITGNASAKDDKRLAHRGVRRRQNLVLQTGTDYDNFLVPHPLECSWNNNYCWGRDGVQIDYSRWRDSEDEARRIYYRKLTRK